MAPPSVALIRPATGPHVPQIERLESQSMNGRGAAPPLAGQPEGRRSTPPLPASPPSQGVNRTAATPNNKGRAPAPARDRARRELLREETRRRETPRQNLARVTRRATFSA